MPFTFQGHPGYLAAAGESLGATAGVVDRARRQPAVSECASLLSQATDAHPAARREMLDHAADRVRALAVAYAAAMAMHDEVSAALFPPDESGPVPTEDTPNQPARRGRKGTHS